jgi:hypothetical protein
MTTSASVTREPSRPRHPTRHAARAVGYGVALLPVALFALVATACGRRRTAAGAWHRLRTGVLGLAPAPATEPPSAVAALGHALLSVLLGATALIPLGVILAFVFRGVGYGLVDHGPYDHSWGGPTRAGAWLVHFLVGAPAAAAAVLALAGVAAVHQRLTLAMSGRRRAPWLIPLAVLIPLPAAAFFVAWLHQI